MVWEEFFKAVMNMPVIVMENLLAGGKFEPKSIAVQINRWQKAGKIIQLKRGIYLLEKTYRKIEIYEPYIASILKQPSYISMEKALEYHNLIPEAISTYTCVTTKRPEKLISKIGIFDYRHIKSSLFWGYNSVTVNKQTAFVASPEKALLDLLYLKQIKISLNYLDELRLQNIQKISPNKLIKYAERFNKPGILRSAEILKKYAASRKKEEKTL